MILNSTARSQEQIKEREMREEAYSFVKPVSQRILFLSALISYRYAPFQMTQLPFLNYI